MKTMIIIDTKAITVMILIIEIKLGYYYSKKVRKAFYLILIFINFGK